MDISSSSDLIENVARWPFIPILERLGMATAIGLLVGLEREHSRKTGVRTFALTALMGCLGGLMGEAFAITILGFVAIFVVGMNYRQLVQQQKLALTTSAALIIVALTGVLFGQGHRFTPAVAGIVTAALLALKQPISKFVVELSDLELRSALLLAILTFIVYPALPDHPVDPWGLIDPKENWASVIIIAGIGFVNYILMKLLGARGMEITAFFGGLINSRKIIVELGLRLREVGESLLPSVHRGILLATGAMLIRNGLIIVVLAGQGAARIAPPLLLMLLANAILWRRVPTAKAEPTETPPVAIESPFKLSAALQFGLVFLFLNVVGALAQRQFGAASFYFVSVAGGLLSSASSIATAATLLNHHEISVVTGANGVIFSTITSILANLPLIQGLIKERGLRHKIFAGLGLIAAVGLAGIALNAVLFAP